MDNENNLLNEETKNSPETLDTKQNQLLLSNKTNVLKDFDEGIIKYDFLLNIKRPPDTKHSLNEQYLSNAICTSKYTSWNAFPKIAFEQFSQIGNLYFLFLAILQMLPFISQSGGSPVMLIPLLLVTGLNGFKDYFEDRKRKISDNKENSSNTKVYRTDGTKTVQWRDLMPGDIIKVNKNEYFPADLVLIYSSNKNGVAFVETKNLDGETNLKYKESVKSTYNKYKRGIGKITRASTLNENLIDPITQGLDLYFECQVPYPNMYDFEGLLKMPKEEKFVSRKSIQDPSSRNGFNKYNEDNDFDLTTNVRLAHSIVPSSSQKFQVSKSINIDNNNGNNILRESTIDSTYEQVTPLEYNNLLLRGSSLRNTDFIIGVVVYAGHHSKIMLNSLNARSKISKVGRKMNSILLYIVICQLLICLIYSLIQVFIHKEYPYKDFIEGGANFIFNFCSWLLAISNLVPISLLVTMEMIRYFQAYFITNDIHIYDKVNKRGAVVQSSGLNEELGQIHYIFTDKTGTLTKNVMQFKYMVVGYQTYGSDQHADVQLLKQRNITNVDFEDKTLFEHWNNSTHPNSGNISKYILALALCHTVIPEEDLNQPGRIIYNASSPDELALVNAAKFFGAEFIERNSKSEIVINFRDKRVMYKLLNIFEFTSDRKRMSIVVRNLSNNQIEIITKGADSLIRPRLNTKSKDSKKQLSYTLKQLEHFGTKGLRTLLVASRFVDEDEYKEFNNEYKSAVVIRNAKEKAKKMDECYEMLEKELNLIGATAIEDCLQDELEETLQAFRSIGMKIFMLTGDHPFTAISIAHSSGLMNQDDEAVVCDTSNHEEIISNLKKCSELGDQKDTCLVITGNSLIQVLQTNSKANEMKNLLSEAIIKSKCVICSRVSPKQKADIVNLVKSLDPSKNCLSIGDGANDVNMINVADVGIGIFGNEGQQAARASDYAIGQFSYLRRLLFVYGRESYRKNTFAFCYVLWKNCLYSLPIICFGIWSHLSASLFYDSIMDTFYNILYTAYPVGWYATADRDQSFDKMEKNPRKYRRGMKGKLFNNYIIIRWYCYAFLTGVLIYVVHLYVFQYCISFNDYAMYDLWTIGASVMTCVVFVVNFKLIFEANIHTIYTFLLMVFSIGTYLILLGIGNSLPSWRVYSVWPTLFLTLNFWTTITMIILVYFAIEYGWRSIQIIIHKTRKKIKKIRLRKKQMKELLERQKEKEQDNNNIIDNDEDDINILTDPKYTGFAYSEDIANVQILMRAQSVKVSGGDVILENEEDEEDDENTIDSHLHYPSMRLTTTAMPMVVNKYNSKFKSILEEE